MSPPDPESLLAEERSRIRGAGYSRVWPMFRERLVAAARLARAERSFADQKRQSGAWSFWSANERSARATRTVRRSGSGGGLPKDLPHPLLANLPHGGRNRCRYCSQASGLPETHSRCVQSAHALSPSSGPDGSSVPIACLIAALSEAFRIGQLCLSPSGIEFASEQAISQDTSGLTDISRRPPNTIRGGDHVSQS